MVFGRVSISSMNIAHIVFSRALRPGALNELMPEMLIFLDDAAKPDIFSRVASSEDTQESQILADVVLVAWLEVLPLTFHL